MAWTKPQSEKRQRIAQDLLKRLPKEGHRTLARKLHDDEPLLFPSIESARGALRLLTGNQGAERRKTAKMPREPRKPGELPPLPDSEAKPWTPFVVDARRVLILSDLHLPYQDNRAIEAALKYGEGFAPDAVLINGDWFDFYQISRFDKDPSKPKLLAELDAGKQLGQHLRQRFPKAKLYFKLGNHDERWDLYLQRAAPLLWEVEEVRDAWKVRAGFAENGIEVIGDQRPVMLGNLPVFHGHELGKSIFSPVNPARGAFLRTHHTILVGHSHQTSGHADTNIWHSETFCWSTGCLCDLTPEYARVNRWNQGFATVTVEADKSFSVCNLRISGDYKVRTS